MTREDIVCMARKAKLSNEIGAFGYPYLPELERFAALVAAAEREACAKVCDERAQTKSLSNHRRCDADLLASAIRCRDQP
jgi:hypothetical protein